MPVGNSIPGRNSPPVIEHRYLNPSPANVPISIVAVGENCTGLEFKIPPIKDNDSTDRLNYLWFFDGKLFQKGFIEPEFRSSAPISIAIDQHVLTQSGLPLNADFFKKLHMLEFYVADRTYTSPDIRYIEDTNAQEAKTYWVVELDTNPCSRSNS